MVNHVWYYVRKYVIIEDFELCPAGIIEQYKKFKMASKMAAMSWFQNYMSHTYTRIQHILHYFKINYKLRINLNFECILDIKEKSKKADNMAANMV